MRVIDVIANQPAEMLFVQRDDMVSRISRRQLPTQRSARLFCHGAWTLVRLGFRPVAFMIVLTSLLNIESLSRIIERYGAASGNASRSCWAT